MLALWPTMTRDPTLPIVVIGAGLAGLGASLALARAGRRVLLLEANDRVGGCCATSDLDGFRFNEGALYVAVPSLLAHAFDRIGLDLASLVPMAAIERPLESHLDDGSIVHLSSVAGSRVEGPGADGRTAMLREGLHALRHEWGPVYRTLVREVLPREPSMIHTLASLWRYLPRLRGNVDTLIARHFPDPGLQAAVASLLLYSGMAPQRLPATQIVGLVALLEEGFWLPRDGMGAITGALRDALPSPRVELRRRARVASIEVARNRIRGVVLADGERIAATEVLATCSGFDVAHNLLARDDVPRRLSRIATAAPLSHRAISLQLGCDSAALPGSFMVNHVPAMRDQGALHEHQPGIPRWLAWTSPSQVVPGLAPAGKATIELFAPPAANGGGDAAADRYVAALRARLPDLEVEATRVRTPTDFERDMHLYAGALYGIAPGAPPQHYFPHRTRLDGLHLAGQTTFPGFGVPSALLSGIQAADQLLEG